MFGNIFALQGMWIQRLCFAWIAWDLTGVAGFVGWIAFLGYAPTLVSGPVFGVLADRTPLLRAAQLTQGGLAVTGFVMAALHSMDLLGPVALSILSLAVGVITSAHHPVRMSLAPLLVDREHIPSVVALGSMNFNLARSVGPALGGAIIAAFGVGAALWLLAFMFLPYIAVVHGLKVRDRDVHGAQAQSILDSLRAGAGRAWSDPLIRAAMAITGLYAVIGRGVLELLPAVADGIFARGAAGVGALTSAAGIGALAAAASAALLPPITAGRLPRAGVVAAFAGLGLVLFLGQSGSWPLTVAAVAGLGATGTIVGVSMQSVVHMQLEDSYRGRVMSLWVMTGVGGSALGAMGLGLLVDAVGLGPAKLISAAIGFLVLVLLLAQYRRRNAA